MYQHNIVIQILLRCFRMFLIEIVGEDVKTSREFFLDDDGLNSPVLSELFGIDIDITRRILPSISSWKSALRRILL